MRLRWFYPLAGAAVLALAALVAAPGPILAASTKMKPTAPTKTGPAEPRGKAAPAPTEPISGPIDTQAKHALIIEAETGAVLLDKGADERMPPASMSKVMTAYVVFGMLKEGRAKLDDELPVSERAWRTGGSKMFVPLGGHIKIDDLLRGMIVQSGNDACIVLAEGLAGSEAAFVDLMNAKAKEIGLAHSHFADVDGLPNPDHYMTARDLVTLALRTIADFPQYYHYYGEKDFAFNNIDQGNRNPLIYRDIGADGLKTGHTEEAGYSLLASAHRDNRRVILVLGGLPTMRARAQESERLIEWAFREFNDYRLLGAGEKVDDAEVWLGTQAKVPLMVATDLVVTMPRKSRKDMKVTLAYDKPIAAPIERGDQIGKVLVTAPEMAAVEAPLLAAASVERMGALGRMAMVAAHLIWGNRR
jgi:serine-type D-Ala-D-Ala carboxypeptidase (penicillin-binding protein 5/6)